MSGQYPPLTCKEVKAILGKLEFVFRDQVGSHEQWVADNPFRKVTVDCPKAPFSGWLLQAIIRQAGVSKKAFYAAR